jgi:cobalt-zinc-cadmium efflux system outer membrane protein
MRSICALWALCLLAFARTSLGAGNVASEPSPRPLGADLPVYHAPAGAVEPTLGGTEKGSPLAETEPEGTLVLRDALAAALLQSPALASFAFELRAQEARILQARQRPNPELALELEDAGGSDEFRGFLQAQTTLQLSQLVELGGKRAARIDAASRARTLAGWDYEARRLDVFSETASAFVEVLLAQEALALAGENLALADEATRAARERLRAGLSPEVEVMRSEIARSAAEIARGEAALALDTARQRLAAQWGGKAARFGEAAGELEPISPPPSLDDLQNRVADNPELARFEAETAEREAALRLARAQALPDVRVGPGVRRLEGADETVFVLAASIPLPLFDRNQGAVAEAAVRLAKLGAERRTVETRLASELAAAQHAVASAFARAEVLRSRTLPAAEASLRAVRDGYLRGRFGQLEVLDAQRTHFGARTEYLRALGDYHRNRNALERLIAAPLEATP